MTRYSPQLRNCSQSICQRRYITSFSQRYRERQMPNFASWRQSLDKNISLHLRQDQSRSFSHLYRKRRLSLGSSHDVPTSTLARPIAIDAFGLLNASYSRTFSASYRNHQSLLLNKVSGLFQKSTKDLAKTQNSQYQARSVNDILASQSFSHRYRERQLIYLRACLPSKDRPFRGSRYVSSVPLLTHMTESDAASRSRKQISWILKILGAGITATLALRFVKDQELQERSILNDVSYVPFAITDHVKISPTSSILTLRSKSDQPLPSLLPISSISIKEPNSNIQRPYTVLSCEQDTIKILVKRYEDGEVSRYIHQRKLDAELFLRMAPSAYTLPTELPEQYLLIMAGTGIVTAYQLLSYLSNASDAKVPRCTLLYASSSREEVYLQKELAALQAKFGERLSVQYFVDSEESFITAKKLTATGKGTTTLVCGSDGFVSYIAGAKPEDGQGELGGLLKQVGASGDVWKL